MTSINLPVSNACTLVIWSVWEYIADSFILDSCSLQLSLLRYECNGRGWDFNTAFMNYRNIKKMCYGIDCRKDIASLWLESWTKKPKWLGVTLIDSWLYVCLSHINTISLVFCVKTFEMFSSKHNINRFYRHLNTKETMFLQLKRRDLTHTHTQKSN